MASRSSGEPSNLELRQFSTLVRLARLIEPRVAARCGGLLGVEGVEGGLSAYAGDISKASPKEFRKLSTFVVDSSAGLRTSMRVVMATACCFFCVAVFVVRAAPLRDTPRR
eukprot:1602114-Prymnesium_polylepis.1